MASSKTTADLINTILRRASIPTDQSTFTDGDILDIMNEEFMANVLPVMLRVHEEYYVYSIDIPVTSGTSAYPIPYRAIGNRIREIHAVEGTNVRDMTRIALEDLPDYTDTYGYNSPSAFYIQNDEIHLVGEFSGTIRVYYYMRPNQLVSTASVGTITSITLDVTPGVTELTLGNFPSTFLAGADFDIVAKRTPNKLKEVDITSQAIDSNLNTIQFNTSDLPDDIAVGDHVCLAEETHIPQLSTELMPILAQRVAIKCLEAMGDTEGMGNAARELQTLETNAYTLIDNRVEGAPRKVVNRNSNLRNSRTFRKFTK